MNAIVLVVAVLVFAVLVFLIVGFGPPGLRRHYDTDGGPTGISPFAGDSDLHRDSAGGGGGHGGGGD